jgi:hypothetical protein
MLARLRSSPRRWAIALFVVPAILIGLVAMHVLMSDSTHDPSQSHAMGTYTTDTAMGPAEGAAASGSFAPRTRVACGGWCDPSHDMIGMLCVFTLVVTGIFLTLHLILIRWAVLRQIVPALAATAAALARPPTLSLHALSISRT